jgi:hypothetical protein
MIRRLALVLAGLLPAACAAPPPSADSPYHQLPVDSRLVLEQPITIPHPGVSVWLQFGKVLSGPPNQYEPACKLEMRERTESSRTVAPDTFRVTKVEQASWAVSADSPFRHAALKVAGRQEDSPMAYEMRTILYLESARQPEVYRLTCQHWDRPWFPQYLTVNQIGDTLRGLFRIEPPA